MKRLLAIVLALVLAFTVMAVAEEAIDASAPEAEQEAEYNLYIIENGQTIVIDGFGEITFKDRGWQNTYSPYSSDVYRLPSLSEMEHYVIRVDILNTQFEAFNFEKLFGDVTCSFGKGYTFTGGHYQTDAYNSDWTKKGDDQSRATGMLMNSTYLVYVTLPNVVQERKNEPLSITFTIGDNMFTYIVRE